MMKIMITTTRRIATIHPITIPIMAPMLSDVSLHELQELEPFPDDEY